MPEQRADTQTFGTLQATRTYDRVEPPDGPAAVSVKVHDSDGNGVASGFVKFDGDSAISIEMQCNESEWDARLDAISQAVKWAREPMQLP